MRASVEDLAADERPAEEEDSSAGREAEGLRWGGRGAANPFAAADGGSARPSEARARY